MIGYNISSERGLFLVNSKIIFMGTPQIAADVLQALLDAHANISLVICQPDRKVGRKGTLQACPTKQLALQYNIPVFQPEKIRNDFQPVVDEHADLIITCAYGQIVPQEVLDAPKHGCVNLHGSLLPEYRGAAPIQRAIYDGKTVSGMSLMKMEAGMDTGPVAAMAEIEIAPSDNTTSLFEKMGKLAGELIVQHLDELLAGTIEFIPQDDAQATHADKISKEEEELDLNMTDTQLLNAIRALSYTPGGYVIADRAKLKLLSVRYQPGETPGIGVFFAFSKKQFAMGGHEGIFLLDEVQPEGKSIMKSADFINGKGRSLINKKAGE